MPIGPFRSNRESVDRLSDVLNVPMQNNDVSVMQFRVIADFMKVKASHSV